MKKRFLVFFLTLLVSLSLVACKGDDGDGDGDGGNTPAFDAAAVVAGFEDKVEGTVKLTYKTNYKVDVVRPGADASGLASFKRDVEATAVVEMDLGADLYIKVTKTRQDKLVDAAPSTMEYLLYKAEGKYYVVSSESLKQEVPGDQALLVLSQLLEGATFEQVGPVTLDTLVYNALDKEYELKVFGLTETFLADELVDPTYSAAANGGLHVDYKPEYVGYRTDMGYSDFPGAEDKAAATISIDTNNKGYVVNMKETYENASLVFNIMSNPPTVSINGERSLTATYGEAITKVDTVNFLPSTAKFVETVGGTYTVMTCPMGQFQSLAPVADGGALTLGNIIAVKPVAAEGYELDKVIVNDVEQPMIDPAMAGGFYCYNVKPGVNTIEVVFAELDPTSGIVNVTNNTSYEYMLQSFTYANGGPSGYQTITDGKIAPGAAVFGAIVIESSKEVVVTVNGVETNPNIPSGTVTYYCWAVRESGKFEVVISEKGTTPTGDGIITVANNTSHEYQLLSFNLVNGAPDAFVPVQNGTVTPGTSVWCAIAIDSSIAVNVTINGAAPSLALPKDGVTYYCFAVKAAGEFAVVINAAA